MLMKQRQQPGQMALSKHSMKALKGGKAPRSPVLAVSTYAQSLKAGSSSSIQASDCERFLAGHPHIQENSRHTYMTRMGTSSLAFIAVTSRIRMVRLI